MEANNFQKLMNEEEERYVQRQGEPVQAKVWGTLNLFRLVGDVAEVFLPRVMDVIVMIAGGRNDGKGSETVVRSRPPSVETGVDPGKIAPGNPEDMEQ